MPMTAPIESTPPSAIVATPGTCGGEPRIAGTRIKVRHVVGWVECDKMTMATILEQFPQLTQTQIESALAYAASHPDEMAELDRQAREIERVHRTQAPPSRLAAKLAAVKSS
jgi:uncharacterized protein (DUF433 family)